MQQRIIKNWTESCQLTVSQGGGHGTVPPIVTLVQDAGSMHFQFSMHPEQARSMAAALLAAAAVTEQRLAAGAALAGAA